MVICVGASRAGERSAVDVNVAPDAHRPGVERVPARGADGRHSRVVWGVVRAQHQERPGARTDVRGGVQRRGECEALGMRRRFNLNAEDDLAGV